MSRRRRSLASGDIVILLDALMRRLGEGLPTASAPRPPGNDEEIGADEEDGGTLARAEPDRAALAKACSGKVRRLVQRMQGQLELAAEPDHARRGVVQLAAVLGVVRTLRLIEQRPEWRRRQLRLVETDVQRQLFESAVLALAWGASGLAPRAVDEAGGEMFDELSMVVGLLSWLAWDADRRRGRVATRWTSRRRRGVMAVRAAIRTSGAMACVRRRGNHHPRGDCAADARSTKSMAIAGFWFTSRWRNASPGWFVTLLEASRSDVGCVRAISLS